MGLHLSNIISGGLSDTIRRLIEILFRHQLYIDGLRLQRRSSITTLTSILPTPQTADLTIRCGSSPTSLPGYASMSAAFFRTFPTSPVRSRSKGVSSASYTCRSPRSHPNLPAWSPHELTRTTTPSAVQSTQHSTSSFPQTTCSATLDSGFA
jgi:hypothetical protein